MKIEASVTSLDCSHGLCPQTQGAVTCTITGNVAAWYSPPSYYIATVSSKQVSAIGNTEFTAVLGLTNTSVTLYWSTPILHPNCIVNYTVN